MFLIFINFTPGLFQYDCHGFYYGISKQCPEGGMLPNPLPPKESNRFNTIRSFVTLVNILDFNK